MKETENLQMKRARHAFQAVAGWPKARRDEAAKRVQGLPVEMRSHGLMVSIATLMKDSRHAHLAETIARWVLEKAPHLPLGKATAEASGGVALQLLRACTDRSTDRASYLAAQTEALALLEHIKRFAAAMPGSDS